MATEEPKKAKVIYSLEGDGPIQKIFREENEIKVQVAKYDVKTGIVEVEKDYTNYRTRISMFLGDESKKFTEFAPIGTEIVTKGVPPRPKKNPRLGTKTPAVVEWYAQYQPVIFRSKYGLKSVQRRIRVDEVKTEIRAESGKMVEHTEYVPIYENVEGLDFDLAAVKRGEQRLIADCKTHITEKLQDGSSDTDGDWDLDN